MTDSLKGNRTGSVRCEHCGAYVWAIQPLDAHAMPYLELHWAEASREDICDGSYRVVDESIVIGARKKS